MTPRRLLLTVSAVMAALTAAGAAWYLTRPGDAAAFVPGTSGPDRLLTNEYAHWNPRAADARRSPDWDVTSGSLYVRGGAGWSGPPDAATPDARSSTGTGSSVFRMNSRRADFTDVRVTLRLRVLRLIDTPRTPPVPTDGVHVMLRRHDPTRLYVASLHRRDGLLVIKKKLTGGTENGGTYTTLAQTRYPPPRPGAWEPFEVTVTGTSRVTITITRQGRTLLRAVDDGRHGPTIARPGSIGLRGDNCEFAFADLRAEPR
ncbi:hypothetical protein [Actinomadura roseirufa]|uniref:hypothetical protein n=1 Tax=Actinomadura roseirufa TaxID=2094049 RepID=UPI0010418F4E|nr:hypothetical protein [Actinomadura roseirufa]